MQKKRTIHAKAKVHAHVHVRSAIPQPTDLEYIRLFDACEITKEKIPEVDKIIDGKVIPGRPRYQSISDLVGGGPSVRTPALSSLTDQARAFSIPGLNSAGSLNGAGGALGSLNGGPGGQSSLFGTPSTQGALWNGFTGAPTPGMSVAFSVTTGRIPWYFIACVHYRECSFSFKEHLHNGDPLTAYTTHVPANRPQVGHPPPFTFEESAVDALKLMGFDKIGGWTLPLMLRKLEAYNGFGYSGLHHIPSPYLWGYSNHYTKGLYVKDGKYDADAVSKQMGTAVILKRMEQRSLISIPRS